MSWYGDLGQGLGNMVMGVVTLDPARTVEGFGQVAKGAGEALQGIGQATEDGAKYVQDAKNPAPMVQDGLATSGVNKKAFNQPSTAAPTRTPTETPDTQEAVRKEPKKKVKIGGFGGEATEEDEPGLQKERANDKTNERPAESLQGLFDKQEKARAAYEETPTQEHLNDVRAATNAAFEAGLNAIKNSDNPKLKETAAISILAHKEELEGLKEYLNEHRGEPGVDKNLALLAEQEKWAKDYAQEHGITQEKVNAAVRDAGGVKGVFNKFSEEFKNETHVDINHHAAGEHKSREEAAGKEAAAGTGKPAPEAAAEKPAEAPAKDAAAPETPAKDASGKTPSEIEYKEAAGALMAFAADGKLTNNEGKADDAHLQTVQKYLTAKQEKEGLSKEETAMLNAANGVLENKIDEKEGLNTIAENFKKSQQAEDKAEAKTAPAPEKTEEPAERGTETASAVTASAPAPGSKTVAGLDAAGVFAAADEALDAAGATTPETPSLPAAGAGALIGIANSTTPAEARAEVDELADAVAEPKPAPSVADGAATPEAVTKPTEPEPEAKDPMLEAIGAEGVDEHGIVMKDSTPEATPAAPSPDQALADAKTNLANAATALVLAENGYPKLGPDALSLDSEGSALSVEEKQNLIAARDAKIKQAEQDGALKSPTSINNAAGQMEKDATNLQTAREGLEKNTIAYLTAVNGKAPSQEEMDASVKKTFEEERATAVNNGGNMAENLGKRADELQQDTKLINQAREAEEAVAKLEHQDARTVKARGDEAASRASGHLNEPESQEGRMLAEQEIAANQKRAEHLKELEQSVTTLKRADTQNAINVDVDKVMQNTAGKDIGEIDREKGVAEKDKAAVTEANKLKAESTSLAKQEADAKGNGDTKKADELDKQGDAVTERWKAKANAVKADLAAFMKSNNMQSFNMASTDHEPKTAVVAGGGQNTQQQGASIG